MKATSSKNENKKRKRDESQEPITESPKKAKVHAQRKFAQGAAFNSPVITPIKDKVRPPASVPASGPMLTSKCPNTEDFLTFLCFRRTSILPAKLDFFKDGVGSEPESSTQGEKSNSLLAYHKCNSEHTGKQSSKKSDKNEDGKKSQAHAVQALRKKYQEQRLAKQKVTNVTKLAQKVKGKNMVRTRSSALVEESGGRSKKEISGKEAKSISSGLRSGLKRVPPPASRSNKKVAKPKHLRSGLRSGGVVESAIPEKGGQAAKPSTASVKKTEKEKKKPKPEISETKTKNLKVKKVEGFSDFSSDDNEPLLAVNKPKMGGKIPGGKEEKKSFVKTRSQMSELESSRVSTRPTRKTKEAAAIYMEMITKKLVSPEKSGDDDVSSVDSFPELPNAKRSEQRETEMKAKVLASKKVEPKQHTEDKTKDTRKISVKKTEATQKADLKNPKDEVFKKANPKKEARGSTKQEDSSVTGKRTKRRPAKEEFSKGKQSVEGEKKEAEVAQPIRPSTRSRHQEETEVVPKKASSKISSAVEEKGHDKVVQSGKKPKATKDLTSPKNEGCTSKHLNPSTASETKITRKGGKKGSEKVEAKGNQENAKEVNAKQGKKAAELKMEEKETESKKGKTSEKKEEKKKGKRETAKEMSPVSKRPTRKCSTADKIWIDLDGFTSDEEDFLDISQATKTRASTKKVKVAEEKKLEKSEACAVSKAKNEKTKDSEKESKEGESLKVKTENVKAEKVDSPKLSQTVIEEKTKEDAPKNENSKTKINDKRESVQSTAKEVKTQEAERMVKEKSEEKTEDVKGTSKTVTENVETSTTVEQISSTDQISESPKVIEEEEKRRDDPSVKETKKSKKLSEEDGLNISEKNQKRRGKSKSKGERNLRGRGTPEESAEESTKRKRPVRQCSTGEKRWIESDSDSFSFYESSDDEDNLPIVDFSGKKAGKPSADAADSKVIEKESVEKVEKKSEGPFSDNFSESDEEPLKKKALIDVWKTESGGKQESVETRTVAKTQREVPGLHPLKKTAAELPAKVSEAGNAPLPVPVANTFVPEPKIFIQGAKNVEEKSGLTKEGELRGSFVPEHLGTPVVSVPNRIEMILHSLKRDKMSESNAPYSNNVQVTFGNVPYQPIPYPQQIPCTYQIKTVNYPPPREPISTHGLDLLSEVALPTTPKEKINSQTERIEKWLKDSLAAEQKKSFPAYDDADYKGGDMNKAVPEKPPPETNYYYGNPVPSPAKATQSSHAEVQKFGQMELLESQKLLKRNLFSTDASRIEQQMNAPKKTLTSVQDLLKLQKERKEVPKTAADNTPHLKNCKCNNCIVKKGWFKNKPVPKTELQKSSPVENSDEAAKPFESLTKAFTKVPAEGKNSKMAVSVAPMVVCPPGSSLKAAETPVPSSSKEGAERKGIFQQRKLSFLERMKERERKEAAAAAVRPSPNAFSPSNESSVYAFEPEPEHSPGVNTPFRSKTRESRTSSTSASRSDEEVLKIYEDETSTVSSGTQVEKPGPDPKVTAKISQSASIAVQVNLDSETVTEVETTPEVQDGKSIEISTQTEVPEEDSDSPMFYIPLQQSTATGASASSDQQLIQGVALKLGTEGPMGPNQRVIMKAKLVTKPPDTPSIKAVVMPQPKRIFDQKNNNPPIGTVQPTARKPPEAMPEERDGNKSTDSKPLGFPGKSDASLETSATVEQEALPSKTTKITPGVLAGKSSGKNKDKTLQSSSRDKAEASDEHSPSSSTSFSKSKRTSKPKGAESVISPSNSTWLPPAGTPSKLVEAPTFHPTEKDFQDPFEFFERIRPAAEKFGLCRIVPPGNFKPDCKVSDDMRFTAYNQYVHRMFHRWGPNIKEMMAIKKYLTTQSISLKQPPWIGGIEVDLPRLYQSVQNCGGLMKVMEKKKWHQVADMMKIPKAAQDRVTKLDDIYCKYLLPYDTLSHDERQKLFDEVENDWLARQQSSGEPPGEEDAEEENYIEECEECVVKGRNMALNQFYRIARNTMSMWFKSPEPSPREVENEFWKHVRERNHHVCVHSGSIDSSGWGYGFPVAKNNSFSKHPWNLKVLTNNCGSVLRSLGPVMGVTVPTLHVGMVFTAFCWYRDPHGLPWIEYLHTGAPKIWYGISDDNSTVFQEALAKLLPRYIKNKTIWLPSDTAMIPPDLLVEHGVSLCHTVQEPGQFILVFPRAFTSSICTGYLVSESVYFAQPSWLTSAEQVFKDIQESCEPSMFSLEKLLFSIATDSRSSVEVLKQVLPMVWHVRQKEIDGRKTLFNMGLKSSERLPSREFGSKKKRGRWAQEDDGDYECEICRMNLHVSLVTNSQEEGVYCLPHAVDLLTQKRHQLKHCKLMYTYTQEEMNDLVDKLEQRIESKSQKKSQGKTSGVAK